MDGLNCDPFFPEGVPYTLKGESQLEPPIATSVENRNYLLATRFTSRCTSILKLRLRLVQSRHSGATIRIITLWSIPIN